ncbi:hypothetical protein [Schlesneria paludicola]|uniref:hypothetical protein n=1 Tax=Schlesneria paludicola TaxID=360056 RepID=UPI00029B3EA4|nr:hypothetical protein [Schlesneria paludicola]
MSELQLRQQLLNVAHRLGRLWLWQRLTMSWMVLSLLVLAWALVGRPFIPLVVWFIAAGLVATVFWIRSRFLATSRTDVARRIEQTFPELNSRLLAALEQTPDLATGRMNVLQQQVVSEAIHHSRINDWAEAVSDRQMKTAFFRQVIALTAFVAIGVASVQFSSNTASARLSSKIAPTSGDNAANLTVEPGNAELERGTSLLVLTRFSGKIPADVQVIWKQGDNAEQRTSLVKSLDDPIFATRLPAVQDDMQYRIDYDGHQTEEFRISVYDLPALVRSDLLLQFPSYTGQSPKTLEDGFEATVVEGTDVTIRCRTNKLLSSARLIAADDSALEMAVAASDSTLYEARFIPTKRMRLKLELIDSSGRKNRDPEEFRIDVVPNRMPDLKLAFPGKDLKVSPLEEISIEASAIDDFEILEAGIVFQVATNEPVTTPLGQSLAGGRQHKLTSIQRLEEFRTQPDELVTYYLYAIDHGPDGERRQTTSDVFFAEVRSFDEIYRQIDQQSAIEVQSPQKPPDSLGKLIELQRQIVVATWNTARNPQREWSPKVDDELATIFDSQNEALEKLQVIRETMSQPQLQPILSSIGDAMESARRELERTRREKRLSEIQPAVAAERSAYQGLLKLRSKEHYLKQSKGNGSGQDNEEKPDLELKRSENRYESEKAGVKKEQSNVNKEALAILDRLKELARRQDGLNQQMKELESQMRHAKEAAERDEIERQLKRLREEQQQLLHDADELRNRLNKSTQPEMVAETKNQLEQTRQRMVDTAEKLREGQVSQALNVGTRAERELKQMHDDFRQTTAAQFADEMRTLRDQSRQLVEREKQLAQQLQQLGDESRRTLRQSQERSQLQSEFHEHRRSTLDLLEKAKHVVEESEVSEPLLSKQLYDTLRSTREMKLEQAMNAAEQLIKQGVLPEAAKAEQQALAGIEHLNHGIEKASESILGNEVESLKRARRELAELSAALEKEIQSQQSQAQADTTGTAAAPNAGNGSTAPAESRERSGAPSGESPAKSNDGQTPAEPNSPQSGSPGDAPGGGESAGRSSDASAPTTPNANSDGQSSIRRSAPGLRSGKAASNSGPAPGREDSGGQDSGGGGSAGNGQGGGPLTGGQFTEFNERLRDVESMISDPQLQVEVQKVRDRARSVRAEFKRHTNNPNWQLVKTSVHQPMLDLQQRLADEIAKRESPDSLVPVDRDPVPTRYRDLVKSYYERLGAGKSE